MNMKINVVLCSLLFMTAFIFSGCKGGSKDEFNKLIVELAGDDADISSEDWEKITKFIDENKAHLSSFCNDDEINYKAVEKYITDYFADRRPPLQITFANSKTSQPLHINFYIERSGSMIPYDAPQGDGTFKAAIVKMLNAAQSEGGQNKVFVVNSKITPYPEGMDKFLSDGNIFESTKGLGDASFTDFALIFNKILNNTASGEISVLVSDMIYSTKKMNGVNPQKIFNEIRGMITSVIGKGNARKKWIEIVKMSGSYNGLYYSYDSPSTGQAYNGKRPYYIMIVGNEDDMKRMFADKQYAGMLQFKMFDGFCQQYLFSPKGDINPFYTLLLSGNDIRGRFEPDHGQDEQITSISGVEADRNSGDIRLDLAVDLSRIPIDESYLTDKNNYIIESDDAIKIKEIRPIKKDDLGESGRKLSGKVSHVIVLEMKQVRREQEVKIKLRNNLPEWIRNSSNNNDRVPDATTTFGFKYLMQGIYDSMAKYSDGTPCFFTIKLKISD